MVLLAFLSALAVAWFQRELALGAWVWIVWTLGVGWSLFAASCSLAWRGRVRQELQALIAIMFDVRQMMAGSAPPAIIRDPLPGDPLKEKK